MAAARSLMTADAPSLAALAELASSGDIRDRAFAASALGLRLATGERAAIETIYRRIRETAAAAHAVARAEIVQGTLDRAAFLAMLREAPPDVREHLVEEILDIAYPGLPRFAHPEDPAVLPEPHLPSGLDEILFALERSSLGPGSTLVDLGSGLGKVVLLTALLTGARAYGVELDPLLVSHASGAAALLGLGGSARFVQGDIRSAPIPPADVYYMYIPVARSTDVAARLETVARERKISVFAPALEPTRVPWLRPTGAASYWLEAYEAP